MINKKYKTDRYFFNVILFVYIMYESGATSRLKLAVKIELFSHDFLGCQRNFEFFHLFLSEIYFPCNLEAYCCSHDKLAFFINQISTECQK